MAYVKQRLEETLRAERGRIVAGLLRVCQTLDAAEDALQDAALAAIDAWRDEVPSNPAAWLTRVARNSALDAQRRQRTAVSKMPLLVAGTLPVVEADESVDAIADDYLRLLFMCCHPGLAPDSQIALTLKVVAGFSTAEIARAFVASEDTISQRILRAKRSIEAHAGDLSSLHDLAARENAVLGVVFAIFNEGHTAHAGALQRVELQHEAVRLGRLLCDLMPDSVHAFGLLALMALGAARAPSREDESGVPVLLSAQDRAKWSRELIREGLICLQHARAFGQASAYLLQAEISAAHITASSWDETDWRAILAIYDALLKLDASPMVALNRSVSLCMCEGPEVALTALAKLHPQLAQSHLFFAIRADVLQRAGRDARRDLARALALAHNDAEKRLLQRRLAQSPTDRGASVSKALIAPATGGDE